MTICKYCGKEIFWNEKREYFEEVRQYGPSPVGIIKNKHDCRRDKRMADQIRETIKELQRELDELENKEKVK